MAAYRLWLRVEEAPDRHFQATVIVLADVPGNVRHEAETRVLRTHQLALAAVEEMAQQARERIMKRGDYVSSSEFV
jgi:hypothetical protein